MNILVIGGGGREHAICAKLRESRHTGKLYCLPGNAGISEIAETSPISVMDFDKIVEFVREKHIDLVFVAPDDPLYGGLVDRLERENIRAFGPRKNAAIIEGSKAFSKEFMKRHDIPTAKYATFDNYEEAEKYVLKGKVPVVIKADGLALGKGVVIATTYDEAVSALKSAMLEKTFGDAGNKVVIEEFLEGREFSLFAFSDGTHYALMPPCQDHKRAYDEDKGPNTGGMGAFCPTSVCTADILKETEEKIVIPTVRGLKEENREFKGVIYFGLMATRDGVKVIEYNARFGDPETQAVLPLLKTDFVEVINACIDGTLDKIDVKFEDACGFCVVAASGGYPGKVVKGYPITIQNREGITIFHAGTAVKDGKIVTNGGRVLNVTTIGESISDCRKKVYDNMDCVSFEGMRFRSDIGIK